MRTPSVPCTCPVTFRPSRWASSAMAASSAAEYCDRRKLVPGVLPPPVTMTLMKSAPERHMRRTASRTPVSPSASRPNIQQ